jgi:7-cyano-7-deazaguanine synthase
MGIVTLVSGGLDSTVMSILAREAGLDLHPLYVDYGQRAAKREWSTCKTLFKRHRLPTPVKMNLSGYGRVIQTGLTSAKRDVVADVFLPGRNTLLLLAAAALAAHVNATEVAIGLLDERERLFEDQSKDFLVRTEALLRTATATTITIRAPLIAMSKAQVLALARKHKVRGTYSCHAGGARPCGVCVSCRERQRGEEVQNGQ